MSFCVYLSGSHGRTRPEGQARTGASSKSFVHKVFGRGTARVSLSAGFEKDRHVRFDMFVSLVYECVVRDMTGMSAFSFV